MSVTVHRRGPTAWTDDRLQRLFERYRSRYWPRSRRLLKFTVANSKLDGPWGRCDYDRLTLSVDVDCHPSDRDVRATVLHEMIHAVVSKGGHGAPEPFAFFACRISICATARIIRAPPQSTGQNIRTTTTFRNGGIPRKLLAPMTCFT